MKNTLVVCMLAALLHGCSAPENQLTLTQNAYYLRGTSQKDPGKTKDLVQFYQNRFNNSNIYQLPLAYVLAGTGGDTTFIALAMDEKRPARLLQQLKADTAIKPVFSAPANGVVVQSEALTLQGRYYSRAVAQIEDKIFVFINTAQTEQAAVTRATQTDSLLKQIIIEK